MSESPASDSSVKHNLFPDGNGAKFLEDRGDPPPWRDPRKPELSGNSHVVDDKVREAVRAAFYLRRPLLVTGDPGVGKSSLAKAIVNELGLDRLLSWPINSRTTLQNGLYSYDAVGRLNQSALNKSGGESDEMIGKYLSLGPMGTALVSSTKDRPRVLLIDELDKSDVDLPNDMLHILEEGYFTIPELARLSVKTVEIPLDGRESMVKITEGKVECQAAPFILMTSNGEREFPAAFNRRCLRLEVKKPNPDQLKEIVRLKLRSKAPSSEVLDKLYSQFEEAQRGGKQLATDQFLNAAFLISQGHFNLDQEAWRELIFRPLQ
jgi:MoxR-like ATPase